MSIHESTTAAATGNQSEQAAKTAAQSSPSKVDLLTCTPGELSAWLLAHRFQDNAMDVASFLLNCTSTLPNAEEISAQLLGGGGEEEDEDDDNGGEDMDEEDDETTGAEDASKSTAPAAAEPKQSNDTKSDPQTTLLQSIQASPPHPSFANIHNNEIEVSCINPRAKFLLSMHKEGMILTNPKKREEEQIPISPINIKNVIWFRKPEDYKKMKQQSKNGGGKGGKGGVPGHMVLICLKEDNGEDGNVTMFRNKPLKQVCFQLPSYPSTDSAGENNAQLTEEDWWNGLNCALFATGTKSNGGIIRVNTSIDAPAYNTNGRKNGFVFQSEGESGSTTTTQGMPYVGCYQGFNDGALFPLREGLLFFKPPLFVPRSKLASISCGRGAGGSRYVDMVVQLDVPPADSIDEQEGKKKQKKSSNDTLEFTNIHRDELNGLNDYIHQTLIPAMQMDADGTDDHTAENDDDGDGSDEDVAVAEVVNTSEDDDDNKGAADNDGSDAEEEEEEANTKRRKRPSRAASKSAREITRAALKSAPVAANDDDSDDSSDEFQEDDESDGSDDDESVVSDGDSSEDGKSEDEEEEEEEMDDGSDGSDYEDRKSKKARTG